MSFGDNISWDYHVQQVLEDEKNGRAFYHSVGNLELAEAVSNINTDTPVADRKMIDCGCHVGRWIDAIAHTGMDYTGIDQSNVALGVASSRRPSVKFINSFLWDINLDSQYDFAMCIAVLQHNTQSEQERIIPRIYKALKPGGVFFFTESTLHKDTETQRTHEHWIQMAERYGFKFIKSLHKNELGLEDFYIVQKPKNNNDKCVII